MAASPTNVRQYLVRRLAQGCHVRGDSSWLVGKSDWNAKMGIEMDTAGGAGQDPSVVLYAPLPEGFGQRLHRYPTDVHVIEDGVPRDQAPEYVNALRQPLVCIR